MVRRAALSIALAALPLTAAAASHAQVSGEALVLRNRGLAELENEQPAEAEATFRELSEAVPDDPLPQADLAVALLRQQRFDAAENAVATALRLAPGRADLLAIRAAILVWSGQPEAALPVLQEAVRADPSNVDNVYALYRHASALRGREAEEATRQALAQLRELRPENLFVLLKLGQAAVGEGDRTTATEVYERIDELAWQAPELVATTLATLRDALEANDLAAARRPSRVLENLFKGTPLFAASLGELFSNVQGLPVTRFEHEAVASFGSPHPVHFRPSRLEGEPAPGGGLAIADLDGDGRPDIAELVAGPEPELRIRLAAARLSISNRYPAPVLSRLRPVDLDNDGFLDLLGWGGGFAVWRGNGDGGFAEATERFGGSGESFDDVAPLDYDLEGDLDLATLAAGRVDILRNSLDGPLVSIGERVFDLAEQRERAAAVRLAVTDLDRDGDLDLVEAGPRGLSLLVNLRQGRFGDGTAAAGLDAAPPTQALATADLDDDGWPDLVLATAEGITFLHNDEGRLTPWPMGGDIPRGSFEAILVFDADNDGRRDLALAGKDGLVVLLHAGADLWWQASVLGADLGGSALAAGDLDDDGDVDLVVAGAERVWRLDNVGGNRNGWLRVRLHGLDVDNQKNNVFGLGAVVEVRAGAARQRLEVGEPVTHIGLGDVRCPEVLRVTWTNGVPQSRLGACRDQLVVEEQVLKGSCPFLYTEDEDGTHFVTDLLWGAPLGMPVGEGAWASADIQELVAVEGARSIAGRYRLHITEELWEAAFFDLVRLWIVDAPAGVELASSLRIVPGEQIADRVLATAEVRTVAAAWDGEGRDVTARVRDRDEVYAAGYPRGLYQGVTPTPWTFTFDLGEAPAAPVRLLLDGWIFPADASLNLAVAQRRVRPGPTRLEMETVEGWVPLLAPMGHPAGKTKTMVLDTPPLPPGVRRLRIVSSQWLHWDRIAWSTDPADRLAEVRARLAPSTVDLHHRGFSARLRLAPNAPHVYDYARVASDSPWLPLAGSYTRYGDVRELLLAADDRLVVLAPGDEMSLEFDASGLPPPGPGRQRVAFLESHGWDKDADRNTWHGDTVEPLPFRSQSGYPWAPGETYPDTAALRRYREQWLTRRIEPETSLPGGG